MRQSITFISALGLFSALVFAAPAVAAEDEASGPIDVEFTLAAVSDYRFRGVSLNNEKLAIQPSIAISHESGVYLNLWGSNIADNGGDDIEMDVTLGYSKEIGSVTADVGVVGYFYPGASGANYGEILGSVSTKVGPGKLGVNVAYAPKQDNIGNQDNFYAGISGEMPLGELPLTLNASFGIEDGAFGDKKKDWSIGADFDIKGVTAGIKYIDTARTFGDPNADATIVFSLSKTF
jgi:uncharacterized protein (TIGR02001 family)